MKTKPIEKKIEAEHGTVCSFPDEFFGYFGWPSVTRLDDGTLAAAASGFRNAHVCPFGRTVICFSNDLGETWSSPRVVNDTPLDDRDAGILALEGDSLIVSWFTSDSRVPQLKGTSEDSPPEVRSRYEAALLSFTDSTVKRWLGSWTRVTQNRGEDWQNPVRVPVTAPHGPIRVSGGNLLYLGKVFALSTEGFREGEGEIRAAVSEDSGGIWKELGTVPIYPGTDPGNYHEPHVVELKDGGLLGLIRLQNRKNEQDVSEQNLTSFSLMQTRSADRGKSWSQAEPLGFHGSPPHLLAHSGGSVICVYGYRLEPYGQRAMITRDGGETWEYDYILRDDGPDGDLGYPASCELDDGSLMTVYYQKERPNQACSLMWTRWKPPV